MERMSRLELKDPSEETVKFGALIGKKLLKWPEVSFTPMFGLIAIYRGYIMFAALPHTRAMGSERAINFKLLSEHNLEYARKDPSLIADQAASGWFAYEITLDNQLITALGWLRRAYDDALN